MRVFRCALSRDCIGGHLVKLGRQVLYRVVVDVVSHGGNLARSAKEV